jgi:hypothetical protein
MALTHSATAAAAMTNASVDLIDGGTTNPTGAVVFMTSGDVEVATCNFSNPAYGAGTSAAPSVATANTISDDTNATGGTIAKFKHVDRDETGHHFGTVTATGGGGDYEISSVTVAASETVSVTSSTYTGPS